MGIDNNFVNYSMVVSAKFVQNSLIHKVNTKEKVINFVDMYQRQSK
jgi:hypothetical protein